MNNLERSRLAERYDEDCEEIFEGDLEDAQKFESSAEAFKRKDPEFYTDIKISHKEDW